MHALHICIVLVAEVVAYTNGVVPAELSSVCFSFRHYKLQPVVDDDAAQCQLSTQLPLTVL